MQNITRVINSNKFFWAILFIMIIFHLGTLSISPLPWYDEVMFADATYNFSEIGKLISKVVPFQIYNEEINVYGPVYFYTQAFLTSILGISALKFRLLNLISSIIIILLVRKRINIEVNLTNFLLLAILIFSPLYIQNSHGGRMDLLATLFVLLAYIILYSNKLLFVKKSIYVAILLSFAMLTTPRAMFLTSGIAIFFLSNIINKKSIINNLVHFFLIFSVPIIMYCLWSFYCYNDPIYLIKYLTTDGTKGYVGIALFNKEIEYIIFILFLILYITSKIKDRIFTDFSTAMLISSITFIFLIHETGPYGAMLIPFEILGIAELIKSNKNLLFSKTNRFLWTIILLGFVGIFSFKCVSIFTHIKERSANNVEEILIRNHIENKNVIASFPYFYELKKKGNNVLNYEIVVNKNIDDMLDMTNKILLPDYLFFLQKDTSNSFIKKLCTTQKFILVDSIIIKKESNKFKDFFANKGGYNSYEGYLYKKIK